jgi:heme A synthase
MDDHDDTNQNASDDSTASRNRNDGSNTAESLLRVPSFGTVLSVLVFVVIGVIVVLSGSSAEPLFALGTITLLVLVLVVVLGRRLNTDLRDLIDEVTDIVAIGAIAAVVIASNPSRAALLAIVSVALGKRAFRNSVRRGDGATT